MDHPILKQLILTLLTQISVVRLLTKQEKQTLQDAVLKGISYEEAKQLTELLDQVILTETTRQQHQ